jgi:hypothetical protein
MKITSSTPGAPAPVLLLAPAFPLDAVVDRVLVDGRTIRPRMTRVGDVQYAEVRVTPADAETTAQFSIRGGSDVYLKAAAPATGARNVGLRVLRSRADDDALRLLLEGRAGRSYDLFLRTPRRVTTVRGATLVREPSGDPILRVSFVGGGDAYTRQEVIVQLR